MKLHQLQVMEYGEVADNVEVIITHPDSGYDYDIMAMDVIGGALKIFPEGDMRF